GQRTLAGKMCRLGTPAVKVMGIQRRVRLGVLAIRLKERGGVCGEWGSWPAGFEQILGQVDELGEVVIRQGLQHREGGLWTRALRAGGAVGERAGLRRGPAG